MHSNKRAHFQIPAHRRDNKDMMLRENIIVRFRADSGRRPTIQGLIMPLDHRHGM